LIGREKSCFLSPKKGGKNNISVDGGCISWEFLAKRLNFTFLIFFILFFLLSMEGVGFLLFVVGFLFHLWMSWMEIETVGKIVLTASALGVILTVGRIRGKEDKLK
jgi:hypothetical protein